MSIILNSENATLVDSATVIVLAGFVLTVLFCCLCV